MRQNGKRIRDRLLSHPLGAQDLQCVLLENGWSGRGTHFYAGALIKYHHAMTESPTDKPLAFVQDRPWNVFRIFLWLGLTSFGGPVAHLGYFRTEFVEQRQWLSDRAYADLVALCQFLPGPASSQVGMALGYGRAGHAGALAAWLGFTLPSALLLMALAWGLLAHAGTLPAGLLQGLKVAALGVVAQAVWGMGRQLCTDRLRLAIMALACCAVLALPGAGVQVGVIVLAALAGLAGHRWMATTTLAPHDTLAVPMHRRTGALWLALFGLLLVGLPLLAASVPEPWTALVDVFYRTGSLVFGGGHVVLPLLQAEVVPRGWIDQDTFMAGYGAAQAVPGPLFTFAAFVGTAMGTAAAPGGWLGGLVTLVAIFVPAWLLVIGALPFWAQLRSLPQAQAALAGVNAAVVGLLLAALHTPIWTGAVHGPQDFGLALLALLARMVWRVPPWAVVGACALAGMLLA